jgi:DtxR family Mn-dependent transcriptional regulator
MADVPSVKRANPRRRRMDGKQSGPTAKEREYLEVMYYLVEHHEPVIAARLARWMGVQPPTVTHVVQQLEQKGLIQRDERNEIALTAAGFELAQAGVQRHRILERFLADVMGMPWHLLHAEAVQLAHALSPTMEQHIRALVREATTCPHGNPIPGSTAGDVGSTQLSQLRAGMLFTIKRVIEEAEENTDLMRFLQANELVPEEQFIIIDASSTYGVTLRRCNHDITVSPEVAAVIWGEAASFVPPTPA